MLGPAGPPGKPGDVGMKGVCSLYFLAFPLIYPSIHHNLKYAMNFC